MKRLGVVGALVYLMLGAVPALAAQTYVNMTDTQFTPATVHVAVNDDVFWCNPSSTDHNVTFADRYKAFPAHSGCSGMTFQTAGTFPYRCTLVQGMSGTVTVGDGGGPGPTAARTTTTRAASVVTTTTRRTTATTTHTSVAAALRGATTLVGPATTTTTEEPTTTTGAAPPAGTVAIRSRSKGGTNTATLAALVATAIITAASGTFLALRARALRR